MRSFQPLLPSVLPAFFLGLVYLFVFAYRGDYLGHFAAGYGATLMALAVTVKQTDADRFEQRMPWLVLLMTAACIAAGAFAEATIYNIARFDEVDFCNQSLGAVVAALGLLAIFKGEKPDDQLPDTLVLVGISALMLGSVFAIL